MLLDGRRDVDLSDEELTAEREKLMKMLKEEDFD